MCKLSMNTITLEVVVDFTSPVGCGEMSQRFRECERISLISSRRHTYSLDAEKTLQVLHTKV
jgi:hypothetical protein